MKHILVASVAGGLFVAACAGVAADQAPLTRPVALAAIQKTDWAKEVESYRFSEGRRCVVKSQFGSGRYTPDWMMLESLSTSRFGTGASYYSVRELDPKDWPNSGAYFEDQVRCPLGAGQVWVDVALTPAGRTAMATPDWTNNGPDHEVRIATRSITQVTGITAGQNQEQLVEFSWEWRPSPAGEIFWGPHGGSDGTGGGYRAGFPVKGTARFKLYDDGWRILSID